MKGPAQNPRCALRRLEPGDAVSIARHANDREIWLNLRDYFPHPYSLANAKEYIAHVATQDPLTSFGIIVDGEAAGSISLKPGVDVERVSAEIGYWLGRPFRGKGIATAAIIDVTTYAFETLKFHRVFAVPFVHNTSSCRALEKAGYVREGLLRRSAVKDGRLLDQYQYAAYDDQWTRPLYPGSQR
ncbi:MAG TPA: GNAT family N-acetyltransferase [Gemmatimonadaceae bacterium]|nr:GNAT family N-acetyltransferase [Gemmatimonadaceae bacterium]